MRSPACCSPAAFGGAAVLLATWSNLWGGAWGTPQVWVRIVDVTLVSTAVVVSAVRVRRERQLARVERIAEVAQRTVLPLIPRQVGPVTTGARYLSAAEDTLVGGDLYDWFHSTGASASWWATCAARESAPSSRRSASSAPSASPLPPAPTWPPWRGR